MRIAALTRPLPGETDNGDGFFVAVYRRDESLVATIESKPIAESTRTLESIDLGPSDIALVALIDGVGHGEEAAAVTTKIIACLQQHWRLDLVSLAQECHRSIAHSRGAVIGISRLDMSENRIDFIGVGNVKLQHASKQSKRPGSGAMSPGSDDLGGMTVQTFVNNNGVVGYNMPSHPRTTTCPYSPGDVVVLSSDGIGSDFGLATLQEATTAEPEQLIASILDKFGLDRDDATAIVVS